VKIRTLLAGAATAALALAPVAAGAQDGTVQVSAVHGVPADILGGDSNVDVYVFAADGEPGDAPTIEFAFGDVAGPLEVPAGDYTIHVYPDGADTADEPVLKLEGATLPAGANVTVVAHLNAAGDGAALTPFVNDISTIAAGEARVTVRHTAAAPAVDVLTGETALIEGLANPDEASLDTAAGTVEDITVTAAGDPSVVALDLGDVEFAEGTSTIVYAIGSLEGETLTAAVQLIEGLHSAPAEVAAGSAGIADGLPGYVLVAMLAGALLLVVPTAAAVRQRR
jgi:hypothetical protein